MKHDDTNDETSGNTINLRDLADRPGFELTVVPPEGPEERAARRRREKAEDDHRRWRERLLHVSAIVVLGLAFALCAFVILREGSGSAGAQWAVPMLTGIVSGFVGYLFGKSG
ncbi:MAG: hypothetical protein M3362_00710 [Acidobacteriota bacterium]|nr:hypothetical protein [Acidobacteriota bacterium]